MFSPDELSNDGFLGGRLKVLQPKTGYRAATDPVLLAAAVPARGGESVLELGCGVGVASLCLGMRVPGLRGQGVERQAAYAELARQNALANGIALQVVQADLVTLPAAIRAQSYDHVIANPPFLRAGEGTCAIDEGRELAFREETPLASWIAVGLQRLRPGGWLTLIHLAERLPDIMTALNGKAGSAAILPIAPRIGRPASRVIVRAQKGGRGATSLLFPFVIHQGAEHLRDGDDYAPEARAILRDGAALTAFS